MQVLAVGDSLPFKVPPGVSAELDRSGLMYFINMPDLNDAEIAAARSGKVECCLFIRQPSIFVLLKIPGLLKWSDAPYSIHLTKSEIDSSYTYQGNEGLLLTIILVDSNDGKIRVLRGIGTSTDFANTFTKAVEEQRSLPFDAMQYNLHLMQTQNQHPSDDMALRGEALFRIK